VHSVFGKINYGGLNTIAYTWDWYCHLVDDRASLEPSDGSTEKENKKIGRKN